MSYSILILLSFLFYSSYVDTFSCKSDNLSVVRVPFSREKCTILFKMHNSMPKKLQETIFRIPRKNYTFCTRLPSLFILSMFCSSYLFSGFQKKHIMLRKKMLGFGLCQNQSQFKKIFSSEHHNTKKNLPLQENFKQASKTTQPESCPPPSHPRLEVLRF